MNPRSHTSLSSCPSLPLGGVAFHDDLHGFEFTFDVGLGTNLDQARRT
jgi:hypothetical protein